jgi:hypothetical protein
VVDLFRTPTIAALAQFLSQDPAASGAAASADAAEEGDERAQRRRALRDRRRSLHREPNDGEAVEAEEVEDEALLPG